MSCGGQVRATLRGPYGLDYGAILAFGGAMGADLGMVAEALPAVEAILVKAYAEESDHAD